MSVEIKGLNAILAQMTEQLGPAKMNQLSNRALKAGAQVVQERMGKAFESFADTGASKNEIVISAPRNSYGVKQIKLGWNGPKSRWRIIHLNENGYTKNGERITPRGFGAIKKSIESSTPEFNKAVEQELRRGLW
jgi:hypothetical protein